MRRALLIPLALALVLIPSALGGHTPAPLTVTVAGSLQSELGCPGDWQPECAATHLGFDAADGVWQRTFSVPDGSYEYKAALNGGWDENYGAKAAPGGDNISLSVPGGGPVKFYYDHASHWITSNRNATIAVAPGSFQSELGCPGDWQPDCLRSWLQDPDGDGVYSFRTSALPRGSYETKVALNESWDVNYGAGGAPGGANIPFTVHADGAEVTFRYDGASHVLTVAVAGAGGTDNDVHWDGLRHDSRDDLYRAPTGAVPAGTPVKIRFRTFHDDATAVRLRLYSVEEGGQRFVPMTRAATDVPCREPGLGSRTCDFWQATLANERPDNLWYRFVVADGTDTDYYADNTPALDGGPGAPTDDAVDQSWALTVYDPAFSTPAWAREAVVYQIFPDRFRNGNRRNDPKTGDVRYDDPVVALPWGTLPEGYCRNYADAASSCPWRFDTTPPADSPDKEQPRGRDYMGGDLRGVIERLDYLRDLGVTTIYFNPIFAAKSNHRYDTSNYRQIDPALGTLKDFRDLVAAARERGIRIVVDNVFNHMSSDSPFFDRYHHHGDVGACESLDSPWRAWFVFRNDNVPCGKADYEGWFGFDSIPVLAKANPEVQQYFVRGPNSVARRWLDLGAAGWRLDVMGDSSFPDGYWEAFRQVVKGESADALIVGELWQKDTTLLRGLRGDRADTTMNYRLRDAVLGLLAPGGFDSKGFADSGRQIRPSEFAARLSSVAEDYAPAAAATLMNLLDSHDTERVLWTLTPGPETRAGRESPENLAEGKRRVRLASLIQFTVPGMPTVYYGDEVGVTGDDDPDDRRTYPWADTGGSPDGSLLAHYRSLAQLRRASPALVHGDLRFLLADDGAGTLAYARTTASHAAVVAVNRSDSPQTLRVPVEGSLPNGLALEPAFGGGAGATVAGGELLVELGPLSGRVLVAGPVDLEGPAAPSGLAASAGDGRVDLSWSPVGGAAGYAVYRSVVSGGGFVRVNDAALTGTSFADTGLRNARPYHYVVRALDEHGNESERSNEARAVPHLTIGWANTQWPPSIEHTITALGTTPAIYGQVWIDGHTNRPGATESLRAEVGFGPRGSSPAGNDAWTWVPAAFNTDVGNNDEFVATLMPEAVGEYDYLYRYTTTDESGWLYADLNGPVSGPSPARPGRLSVVPSSDTTAPATPTGLRVVGASPAGVELAWNAVAGDPTLYGYELLRSDAAGGPYRRVARVTAASATDLDVVQGRTYHYVVRSVDTSFNRSGSSGEVAATAELRTVQVTFTVTVPSTTDSTGRSVYIAGTLDRLTPPGPVWNPGGIVLTRVDATHWRVTLRGLEGTQIEYKYALGDWDHVEKDGSCGEIANRQLTLAWGAAGEQPVADAVPNWRNVAPCGN